MALSGNWKASRQTEVDVQNNLGTGWNPIHAIRDQEGRNIALNRGSDVAVIPDQYVIDPNLDDPAGYDTEFAYDATDDAIWGYGPDSGTSDRPSWGDEGKYRDQTQTPTPPWPEWGPYTNGIPGGTTMRDNNRGADLSKRVKQRKSETVSEGWENKQSLPNAEDAVIANDSQIYMQTSMTQRDARRTGSQAAQGRANAARASIGSRIIGMRLKIWSGGERHYDMTPRTAEERIRPWWTRQAGTGDPALLESNAMEVRQPIARQVPAEPDQGDTTPLVDHTNYGFVSEDVLPYV